MLSVGSESETPGVALRLMPASLDERFVGLPIALEIPEDGDGVPHPLDIHFHCRPETARTFRTRRPDDETIPPLVDSSFLVVKGC